MKVLFEYHLPIIGRAHHIRALLPEDMDGCVKWTWILSSWFYEAWMVEQNPQKISKRHSAVNELRGLRRRDNSICPKLTMWALKNMLDLQKSCWSSFCAVLLLLFGGGHWVKINHPSSSALFISTRVSPTSKHTLHLYCHLPYCSRSQRWLLCSCLFTNNVTCWLLFTSSA